MNDFEAGTNGVITDLLDVFLDSKNKIERRGTQATSRVEIELSLNYEGLCQFIEAVKEYKLKQEEMLESL